MGANSKGLAGFCDAAWRCTGRAMAMVVCGHSRAYITTHPRQEHGPMSGGNWRWPRHNFTYHAWKHLSRARCCLNARKQGYMSHPWPRMHQATAAQAHITAWFAYLGHNCGYRTPNVTHTRYRWANVNTLYRVLMPCDADPGASSHTWPLHSPR